MKTPTAVSVYMEKIGRKGGKVTSEAKAESSRRNAAKALAARQAKKKLTT